MRTRMIEQGNKAREGELVYVNVNVNVNGDGEDLGQPPPGGNPVLQDASGAR